MGLSAALSAIAGTMLGYLLAAATVLGEAVAQPPGALPPAPVVADWMAVGAVAGAGVGVVKGGVALAFRKVNRRWARHGIL